MAIGGVLGCTSYLWGLAIDSARADGSSVLDKSMPTESKCRCVISATPLLSLSLDEMKCLRHAHGPGMGGCIGYVQVFNLFCTVQL
jgi:hypothetical protein